MRIFYDVDTQNDFMNKNGRLYVPDAELIKPNLALLTDYAIKNFVPIVGEVDEHFGTEEYKERETELARWGGPFPDHCMVGTEGAGKIKETSPEPVYFGGHGEGDVFTDNGGISIRNYLIRNTEFKDFINKEEIRVILDFEEKRRGREKAMLLVFDYWLADRTGINRNLLEEALREVCELSKDQRKPHGVYFEKQSYDIFTNPAFDFFLKMADVREAVVYGVATDFCVKAAVLGMQKRGVQCCLVTDAIKGVFPDKTKEALEEMARAGAKFVTTKDVLEGRLE